MTKEKAIQILNQRECCRECVVDNGDCNDCEKAFEMAIKALEQDNEPIQGTCKDCTNYVVGALDEEICIRGHELIHKDFYCADYKKRGNEK